MLSVCNGCTGWPSEASFIAFYDVEYVTQIASEGFEEFTRPMLQVGGNGSSDGYYLEMMDDDPEKWVWVETPMIDARDSYEGDDLQERFPSLCALLEALSKRVDANPTTFTQEELAKIRIVGQLLFPPKDHE